MYLDQCLSYDEHIRRTVASCMNKLIQIKRIKHLLDKDTLLLIINSLVFSRLFYCSSVWSNTSATNIHKLQLVQNFAARIILGLRKYDHISAGLRSFRWLNVKQRLKVNDAVMMHQCVKGPSPNYDSITCRINFQLELLSMIDRQVIEITSIFHLAESMLANALFITMVRKYGIIQVKT